MSHDPNPNKRQSPPHAHAPCNMQAIPHHPPAPATARPPRSHHERGGRAGPYSSSPIFCALRGIIFFLFIRAAVRDTVLRMWHWRAFLCHLSLMLEMPTVCHLFVRFFFHCCGAVTLSFNQKRCSKYHLVPAAPWCLASQ